MTNASIFKKVITDAKKIIKGYDLCDYCLGRLFAKKLSVSSNKLLGKKIRLRLRKKSTKNCYICKNLFSNLVFYISKMFESSSDFQFSTFVVGVILKPSIVDRDDIIRSRFKLRGIESVKTAISKEIGKMFARKTNATIDQISPDLTLTINFKNDSCELRSKSLYLHGRYTKKMRSLPQKQKACENCSGKGCFECNHHGISKFNSVEGKMAQFLFEKFGAMKTKFTWIGGENKTSLVFGKGRPFFVKLISPHKRKVILDKEITQNGITIKNLSIIDHIPKKPIQFKSKIRLLIDTENKIKSRDLLRLKNITKSPIVVNEKFGTRSEKSVYDIKYKKTSPKSLSIMLRVDGGFPIKRFVDDDDVNPNLSEVLKNRSKCKKFDFHEIELI